MIHIRLQEAGRNIENYIKREICWSEMSSQFHLKKIKMRNFLKLGLLQG